MLSDETMQELLRIELLQQVLHRPIARRMMSRTKNSVRLQPRSENELLLCLEKIRHHAEEVTSDSSVEVIEAAKRACSVMATVEDLVAFAKLYYHEIETAPLSSR